MSAFRTLTLSLVLLGLSSTAGADPVVVTSGRIVFDFEGDWFDLQGESFAVNTSSGTAEFLSVTFARDCFPCFAGETLDLSFVTTPREQPFGSGPGRFNGTSYPTLFYRTEFSVNTDPLTFPDGHGEPVDVRQAFTMSGTIRAYTDPGFSTPAFSLNVGGRGRTLTTYHFDFGSGGYLPEEGQLAYIFDEAAPVPEPMSLLLFGTGLFGIAARRMRLR